MCVIALKVAVNVIQSSRMERCLDRIVVLAYHDQNAPTTSYFFDTLFHDHQVCIF